MSQAELLQDLTINLKDLTFVVKDIQTNMVTKTEFNELRSDVAVLKTDMIEVKSDISELKSDVSGLKSDVSELKFDVSNLKSDVSKLNFGMEHLLRNQDDMIGILGMLKDNMITRTDLISRPFWKSLF